MSSTRQVIFEPELGTIFQTDDGLFKIRAAATLEELDFKFGDRRRICLLGQHKARTPQNVISLSERRGQHQRPMVWMPFDDQLRQSRDLPENPMVIFERKLDWSHWSGRATSIVGPWTSHDDNLYVLTVINAEHFVAKRQLANGKQEFVWAGAWSLGTGCRIDTDKGAFPSSSKGIEFFRIINGREFPVVSKDNVYGTLKKAHILVEEPEEERRSKTGWRNA